MTDVPRIISVDDHVLEPPDLWASRLPARYRDRGPRVIRQRLTRQGGGRGGSVAEWVESDDGQWCDVWHYDGLVLAADAAFAAVGVETQGLQRRHLRGSPPGAWNQKDRLPDMDMNHVDAALCFPNTLPRFCGQTFYEGDDHELGLALRPGLQRLGDRRVVGRRRPGPALPGGHPAAVGRRRSPPPRSAAAPTRAAVAVSFPENPHPLGLPSLHDRTGTGTRCSRPARTPGRCCACTSGPRPSCRRRPRRPVHRQRRPCCSRTPWDRWSTSSSRGPWSASPA